MRSAVDIDGVLAAGRIPVVFPAAVVLSVVLILLAGSPSAAGDLVLNELLAVGGDLADEDGDFSDWIEIHNRGASAVELDGWYLTDDAADLRKWRFPPVTLSAGGYLVVFASDKDRAEAGEELHTSFRLSSTGEYLALVMPDGASLVDAFAPAYPEQYDDVSFGIEQAVQGEVLIGAESPARYLVPAGGEPDGWADRGFDDGAWSTGELAIGFDTGDVGTGDLVNIAPIGTAVQSSDYAGGGFPAGNGIDGDLDSFTHTAAGVNLPATWELDLGEPRAIHSIVLHNRTSCCASRLRDITVSILDAPDGTVIYATELLNPENVLGGGTDSDGPDELVVDLVERTGGTLSGRVVRVVRTPDPDLSGTGGDGNDDEADVLSLGEVEVLEGYPSYHFLLGTDVGAAMQGVNGSIFIRIPFEVEDPSSLQSLLLRMIADDGYVAYLNGVEIASRHAPAVLAWNSIATSELPDEDVLRGEEIDLTTAVDLLQSGTNWLAIHGLNIAADDEDFLILPELLEVRVGPESLRYFRNPTPGARNDTEGVVGFVEDTRFSQDRGFYETPFEVEITTATEGAEIRYTFDGRPPTQEDGLLYEGPILIDRTTTLRARAFKEGLVETNVDTQTYIFVDDVIGQDHSATLAYGFPSTWGGTSPDYGMDPDIVGPNDRYGGEYAATIREDLKSIPTLSIVMDIDDMFGSRGIYTFSTSSGVAWERPASAELVYADGGSGFQVDCGIRIQGGYFRQHSATRKHSLRLLFKREYGPTKLRFPLFGRDAVEKFDTITLRAGANDGYSWDAARLTEQYTRDEFGRSLQVATGNAGSHGMFVHLYINGIYWGLYNPVERPDHSFSASYYGGEKEDWDSVHDGAATSGDTRAWNDMIRQTARATTSLGEYMKLQGMNPDGTLNPAYPHLLDAPNYVDYLVVNLWGGNWDWPWKNWWAGRDRTENSTGFKFYTWDYENTVGNNRARSPLTKNALGNDFGSTDTSRPSYANTGQPHTYLRTNPEYRLLFADSAHRHLFHGGVLTPESLIPRYAELADNVERAIVGESARWGDQHYNPPLTLAEWYAERDWILGTYLPQRSDIVLGQFRAAGLYPAVDAPEFSRHGGRIEAGFRLTMTAPGGVVYYTLDGTDPRLPGGTVSPGAIPASDVAPIVLMAGGGMARAHVPADGSLGLDWTLPGFDDSTWREGTMGVGFDAGTGYEDHIALDLEDIMHEVNSAAYIRIPFTLDPALFDGGSPALILLNLLIQYDDGFIAYINGTRVKAVNAPEIAEWNSHATLSHSDALAVQFERVALEDAVSLLEPGENLLAIHGLNVTSTNSDFLISAGLEAVPASEGIALEHSILVQARALDGTEWSALNSATFVVDVPLRITEIMYHPAPPPEGSLFDESHFEFIELQNVGDEAIELADLWLDDGIWFDFAESPVTRLLPGRILVLVKNAEAFASRYGTAGILVGGEYGGKLDNRGDRVILRGPYGEALLEIDYGDDWEPETDGMGPSLVIVDPHGDPDAWGDPSSWRASSFAFGSPGVDESSPEPMGWQLPGDLNQDGELNISDPVALLAHLFLGRARVLPCDDGSSLLSPGNLSLLDSNGDAGVDLSDAVHLLGFLFLGGPVPARGAQCTVIPGCPDVCR